MKEIYTTTKNTIEKVIKLQSNINDKEDVIRRAKINIIDNVLKLDNTTNEQTKNYIKQTIKKILNSYPFLNSYVTHIHNELR